MNHPLPARLMHTPRTCKDCTGTYRYSDTHTNSRYCPTCVPNHPRRCATCTTSFHPTQDSDRHCPVCAVHPVLFEQDNQP